jgi:hypothetical protein
MVSNERWGEVSSGARSECQLGAVRRRQPASTRLRPAKRQEKLGVKRTLSEPQSPAVLSVCALPKQDTAAVLVACHLTEQSAISSASSLCCALCPTCGRQGRYRVAPLVAELGRDARLTDFLHALTRDCLQKNQPGVTRAVPVPAFGPRMVCTSSGIVGADARPNWLERAGRESLTGKQWTD